MNRRIRTWKQRRRKARSRRAGEEDPIWSREKFPECQDLQLSTAAEGIRALYNHITEDRINEACIPSNDSLLDLLNQLILAWLLYAPSDSSSSKSLQQQRQFLTAESAAIRRPVAAVAQVDKMLALSVIFSFYMNYLFPMTNESN
jgi:hypothetical protein